MKAPKVLLITFALLVASIANAWAGGRVYGGVSIGIGGGPGPYWGGGYYWRPYWGGGYYGRPYFPGPYIYPGPYYAPQAVVVVPSEPQVYIEQEGAAALEQAPEGAQYWYFCRGASNYYPYVKECPGGWQKVLPRPAE